MVRRVQRRFWLGAMAAMGLCDIALLVVVNLLEDARTDREITRAHQEMVATVESVRAYQQEAAAAEPGAVRTLGPLIHNPTVVSDLGARGVEVVESPERAAGKTLVIATHDQSLADEVADYFVYVGEFHGYEDRPHLHINI